MTALLDQTDFRFIVRHAPLVSIDLLVTDANGRVLVGHRSNPPAQGYWFVPGGRVRKNEALAQAFERVTLAELGQCFSIHDAHFKGVYEHFYAEDFTGSAEAGTHYVVLAYALCVEAESLKLPAEQHDAYRWVSGAEGLADTSIHANARAYFKG